VAALGDRLRVELPDGTIGSVRARDLADVETPLRLTTATGDLLASPLAAAPVIDTIAPGVEVRVLGRFGSYSLIQLPDARTGWIAAAAGDEDRP
jgi:hypothetical protein